MTDVSYLPSVSRVSRWRNGSQVVVNAEVFQTESPEDYPGHSFLLRFGCGSKGSLTVQMVAAEATFFEGVLALRGFVSKQDLAFEDAFWRNDEEGMADARDRDDLAEEFAFEQWRFDGA